VRVEITKSTTTSIGRQIISDADEFRDCTNQLDRVIDNIAAAWTGDDATLFTGVVKSRHIAGLHELADTINEYGQFLANVPEAYVVLDETFAGKHINV